MNAKKYLNDIKTIDRLIDSYQREVDVLMAKLTSTTSKPKDVNVMSSKEDTLPESVEKLIKLKNRVNDAVDKYVDMKSYAMDIIEQIDNLSERIVLVDYYFHRMSLEKIAVEMGYTYQWVFELRNRGISDFEKIANNSKKNSNT